MASPELQRAILAAADLRRAGTKVPALANLLNTTATAMDGMIARLGAFEHRHDEVVARLSGAPAMRRV